MGTSSVYNALCFNKDVAGLGMASRSPAGQEKTLGIPQLLLLLFGRSWQGAVALWVL
jgi:hypothetical protein